MDDILLTGFAGSASDVKPRLLDDRVGVSVTDAQPAPGDLRPLNQALQVLTLPNLTQQYTIFRLRQGAANNTLYWLTWPSYVSIARSNDGDDTTERIYYTGDGAPKFTDNVIGLAGGAPYPQGSRLLAVPAPVQPALLTMNTDGTGTEGDRFYVSTYVNDLGWESAPSPVSAAITAKPGANITISNLEPPPGGNYGITLRRIYRTQPGTAEGAANFYFLREVAVGATSTTDDARALGEVIATIGWLPLPDGAIGIIDLWNGMMAMIVGKTIVFAEPNAPYAQQVRYDQPISDKPVALAKWEQNLLVLTEGPPRLFNGQDPISMTETPFRVGFACAQPASVVGFEHGVAWASNEGLAYTGSEVLLTKGIVTPEDWKLLRPETMVAGRWKGLYVCSYLPPSGPRKGFMFDPLRPQLGIWYLSTGFDACHYDELADRLYVLEGANIKEFNGSATKLVATFKSKAFRQRAPRNFAFAKIVAESYPATIKVWADGILRCDRTVANDRPFTAAPANFKATDWQVEVGNDDSVEAVHLAADIRDIRATR